MKKHIRLILWGITMISLLGISFLIDAVESNKKSTVEDTNEKIVDENGCYKVFHDMEGHIEDGKWVDDKAWWYEDVCE